MYIYHVYVIGKNTPNKRRLFYSLAGKELDPENSSDNFANKLEFVMYEQLNYTLINVTEDDVDSLKKDETVNINYFFYVYDVDDRETFEKFESIHQKVKPKFGIVDNFVLYGINCNIEGERSVSVEDLMATAAKNKINYFELQEFNTQIIHCTISLPVVTDSIVYVAGTEQSGYKEMICGGIMESFKSFKICNDPLVPTKIEDMEPLQKIVEKTNAERRCLLINFIYSPYDRETFTAIEEYVSKSTDIHNYYKLDIHIAENKLHEDEEKAKEVTSLEMTRFCKKYKINKVAKYTDGSIPEIIPEGLIHFDVSNDFDIEKYGAKQTDYFKYRFNFDPTQFEAVDLFKCVGFSDIHFSRLIDGDIALFNEGYNYLTACDCSTKLRGSRIKAKQEETLKNAAPKFIQHYFRFKKNDIVEVFKQYRELQEPAEETIHVIGNSDLEELLLDEEIIGFIRGEECKLVQFNNHIYKYKIEFHEEMSIDR